MKTMKNQNRISSPSLAEFCRTACWKLIAQMAAIKTELRSEFKERFGIQERLLHLALNEAEALAWQTEYPHLLFPTLAVEKAQEVASWNARQQALRQQTQFSFAA
jgi:hypothetical protein